MNTSRDVESWLEREFGTCSESDIRLSEHPKSVRFNLHLLTPANCQLHETAKSSTDFCELEIQVNAAVTFSYFDYYYTNYFLEYFSARDVPSYIVAITCPALLLEFCLLNQ